MCFPNISQIQPVVVRNQERSETQLRTVTVSLTTEMLGFTRFLFDVTSLGQVDFSIVFQGSGGIRSTQPTELFYPLPFFLFDSSKNASISRTESMLPNKVATQ